MSNEAPLTECDRLAANPPDPDRIALGVARENVDLPLAITACRAAVAQHPDTARLSYQLGRCLFYQGQIPEALASFQQAAALGYRQAHFILGLISLRRYPQVPYDVAVIERHWRTAAQMGHANALVSYVHEALKGTFDRLPARSDRDELKRFLERARPQVDYLGGLLVDMLSEQLSD